MKYQILSAQFPVPKPQFEAPTSHFDGRYAFLFTKSKLIVVDCCARICPNRTAGWIMSICNRMVHFTISFSGVVVWHLMSVTTHSSTTLSSTLSFCYLLAGRHFLGFFENRKKGVTIEKPSNCSEHVHPYPFEFHG